MHKKLFRQVLLDPAKDFHGGQLRIVSGFATANMADRHMEYLSKLEIDISIDLIVGMTAGQGIEEAQHRAFCKLSTSKPWELGFQCQYVSERPPVHAKTYVWLDKNGNPKLAFCGSANYTLSGFGKGQIEFMSATDPLVANQFYDRMLPISKDCNHPDIENMVRLLPSRERLRQGGDLETVRLSLFHSGRDETPKRSGINWGQRQNRNKDQAYIHIPVNIQDSDFFPDRKQQFTVLTDDGVSFICVRAQDNGKGIHTTQDNSILGAYLRARMGVASGEYVTKQHLMEYGRTDVTFCKVDSETYLLDFSPDAEPGDDAENWPEK